MNWRPAVVILELTENEAKAVQNELWLRMHAATKHGTPPTGSYLLWLKSASAKIHDALPAPSEFADNH